MRSSEELIAAIEAGHEVKALLASPHVAARFAIMEEDLKEAVLNTHPLETGAFTTRAAALGALREIKGKLEEIVEIGRQASIELETGEDGRRSALL